VAGHQLIDDYLAELVRRLPADAVDELADGLEEAFRHHQRRGLSAAGAAAAATSEFGNPDLIVREFIRQAPGRRAALALLASGPLFAGLWGSSLISAQAWTWPIPLGAAAAFGATLLAVVATLVIAVLSRSYQRTKLTGPACALLAALDGAMIAAIAMTAPALSWPMALAIPASIVRIGLALRTVPRILTR
jgi:hypothetical protein